MDDEIESDVDVGDVVHDVDGVDAADDHQVSDVKLKLAAVLFENPLAGISAK